MSVMADGGPQAAINTTALSNWVNGSQTVGYVSDSITMGTGTMTNYCGSCSAFYYGWHYCAHHCTIVSSGTAHEHDFAQATSPYESTLFCRKCGETKRLKLPKEAAK